MNPSSGMPIYEHVETQDKKGRKQNQKSFNPFVEVHMRDGLSTFIRKTTAVWLLQEGERVSTDHLFRVRHKQPYSTDIYASTTSTYNIGATTTEITAKLDAVIPLLSLVN